MDGSAARGRLDILRTLRRTRSEGCSFDASASGGHAEVLDWLYKFYDYLGDRVAVLEAAARNGHAEAVEHIRVNIPRSDTRVALAAAAANNHIDAMEALRP
ncbi:unnamed protein product [Phytophthora lilii]|uniref:Unnamed protein product n=1 Tax=Phytophthora lilii TaxID=2077276 RepID=A0A9W6X6I6_9STRA|nr:unnamed protein product [Phytophthora lilii]